MDVIVTPTSGTTWSLTDRLGRDVGRVTMADSAGFKIEADTGVLSQINPGPFASLGLAMSEIEKQTRGACQLADG